MIFHACRKNFQNLKFEELKFQFEWIEKMNEYKMPIFN